MMKRIVLFLGLIFCISIAKAQETGTFKDTRDGQIYKTVKIGSQIWFAENLRFKTDNFVLNYNNENYLEKYGYLYISEQAANVCPEGWHLPSLAEWDTLASYIQLENNYSIDDNYSSSNSYYLNNVGMHLKASSGWKDNGNGDNLYNFNALPGGMHNYDGYVGIGWQASWWSVEKNIITIIWKNQDLIKMEANPYAGNVMGFSVRCVKD